jgi:hypothetical protein
VKRVRAVPVTKLQAAFLARVGVASYRVTRANPSLPVAEEPKMDNQSKPLLTNLPKAPRTMERLSQGEYYRLYKWLEAPDTQAGWAPGVGNAAVAAVATEELGFKVTEWIMRGALETCGLTLPPLKRVVPADEAVRKLAVAVDALLVLAALAPNATQATVENLQRLSAGLRELL